MPESCWCSLQPDSSPLPSFMPPNKTAASCPLKHRQVLSNEPEVTPFHRLWQGPSCWELGDLEVACRCVESGRVFARPKSWLSPQGEESSLARPVYLEDLMCFLKSVWVTWINANKQFLFSPLSFYWAPMPALISPYSPLHYLAACGKLNRLVHVIALMKACLISIVFVCSSQIVPRSLVAKGDL